jgi:cysteine dioxygenase
MAHALAIGDWVEQLKKIPEKEFTIPRVQEFLTSFGVWPETLQPYLFFSKGSYTRNLIHKSPLFELIAICWEVGQASRIHNHRGQKCWMAVPIGRLKVQNFRVETRDARQGTCRLAPIDAYEMDAEHPAAVDPLEPVHQVLNLPEYNQRAVSLHIYSHPYDSCEVYLLGTGTYSDVPLRYTSEYGKLSPEEKLV